MDQFELAPPSAPGSAPRKSFDLSKIVGEWGDGGVSLIDLLQVLRRRRTIIFACIALITVIGTAVVFQLTPRYTAVSSVLLDTRKTQVLNDVQSVLSGVTPDFAMVRGEIEILKSPLLAAEVVQKLKLNEQPEFNPRLRKAADFAPVAAIGHWIVDSISPLMGGRQEAQPVNPADPDQAAIQTATAILMHDMDFTNDGRSYVIQISAQSESPQLAADIANAYADAYLDSQLEAKYDAVKRANDWLNEHLTTLQAQVEASDRAVEEYRAQHQLTQTAVNGPTLTDQQLGELNSQLIEAQADLAQKQANLDQIQTQMRNGGSDATAQVLLGSGLIQTLRQQEADLVAQEAQLATKYKPEHPAMINIKAQEHDVEQKIRDEVTKVVQGMAGDVASARAKVASLKASLDSLQSTSNTQNQATVELRELQREADSNRTLYQDFLDRFKQTTAQEDIQQADARIIATARPSGSPSYPRVSLFISLVFLSSIVVGLGAAFAVEQLDNGFRTGEQLEKIAHVTPLGLVPDVRNEKDPPQETVVTHPVSPYAESIRTIRTALRYSDVDNPPKVILITSSLPDEGKSVFALSLARSVSFSGGRSLLVDCDLRRPSIAKLLHSEDGPGLLSLFESDASIARAIRVDAESGMHYIAAAGGTANPQDLLGSRHFRTVLQDLRQKYDLIVLDTPPVLAVSDALILSHSADTTMFLVRWGRTARPVVTGALKSFRQHGGHLAGVVLSRVDFRRHATYGYGDAGYYYGYYGRHYASYDQPYVKSGKG